MAAGTTMYTCERPVDHYLAPSRHHRMLWAARLQTADCRLRGIQNARLCGHSAFHRWVCCLGCNSQNSTLD